MLLLAGLLATGCGSEAVSVAEIAAREEASAAAAPAETTSTTTATASSAATHTFSADAESESGSHLPLSITISIDGWPQFIKVLDGQPPGQAAIDVDLPRATVTAENPLNDRANQSGNNLRLLALYSQERCGDYYVSMVGNYVQGFCAFDLGTTPDGIWIDAGSTITTVFDPIGVLQPNGPTTWRGASDESIVDQALSTITDGPPDRLLLDLAGSGSQRSDLGVRRSDGSISQPGFLVWEPT